MGQSTKGGAIDFDFEGAKARLTAALFLASRQMMATFKLERRHIEVRLNVPHVLVSEKLANITTFRWETSRLNSNKSPTGLSFQR
jgi:hypothetical protein